MPAVAKSWEISEDGKEFTFYLREGMKWSDGEPYTADDVMCWYEDVVLNDEITPTKPSWMRTGVGGEYGTVEKVDDYTVTLHLLRSPTAPSSSGWAPTPFYGVPGHYLEQFHVDYTDKAEIEKVAKEKSFEQWFQYFSDRNNAYNNPDRPVVGAWQFTTLPDANPLVAERNPYYYRVDEQGQQLPYIDTHPVGDRHQRRGAQLQRHRRRARLPGAPDQPGQLPAVRWRARRRATTTSSPGRATAAPTPASCSTRTPASRRAPTTT